MSIRSSRVRHLVVLIWSLIVAVLLLAPVGDDMPRGGVWDWLDKPAHALVFAIHCGLLALSLHAPLPRGGALAAAIPASGLYAVLLEALQMWVPGRAWEWWDVAADFAGIALVALVMARLRARLPRTS